MAAALPSTAQSLTRELVIVHQAHDMAWLRLLLGNGGIGSGGEGESMSGGA